MDVQDKFTRDESTFVQAGISSRRPRAQPAVYCRNAAGPDCDLIVSSTVFTTHGVIAVSLSLFAGMKARCIAVTDDHEGKIGSRDRNGG